MENAIAPPSSCPISWQPNALTPVFYGQRDYGTAQGAPVPLRVFFPSIDGSPASAAILANCGRYPVILFAHGHCQGDTNHYQRWIALPAQLARSGYVVVVPQIPSISTTPSATHPALAAMTNVLNWLRQTWEHRLVLMPASATGVAGHSFGGLLTAQFAKTNTVTGYAGVGTDWHSWSGTYPIFGINRPKLVVWGGVEFGSQLDAQQWNSLSAPKHRAVFTTGEHWDYLPAGQSPCDPTRGPCSLIPAAAADLVTMFFAQHMPPELSPNLPSQIPDNLFPPQLVLTPEQEFFAGGHLVGMRNMAGRTGCEVTLTAVMGTERTVPDVRELPKTTAQQVVLDAGLQPVFSGSGTWVYSQSPQPGMLVAAGSKVTMTLRSGPIP